MNNQISYCVVAAIFIGASFLTIFSCKSCGTFVDYQNSLDDKQKQVYEKIVNERQMIYIVGLIIGSLIALGYLYATKGTLNPISNSCIFTAIAMSTQYMIYTLYPKSDHMIKYLDNADTREKWLNVYNTMKFRYHVGMLLGLVGYFALSYGLSQNWFQKLNIFKQSV